MMATPACRRNRCLVLPPVHSLSNALGESVRSTCNPGPACLISPGSTDRGRSLLSLIAQLLDRATAAARVMVPTFGLAGIIYMTKRPEFWGIEDYDGSINWLPVITVACLAATLLMLLRAK